MQSILIIGKEPTAIKQCIDEQIAHLTISPFDIASITKETLSQSSKSTSSIGISVVREMQQKVFLKPLQGQYKAVILYDAELLTQEAQNALLKVLEEPPESTTIILVSTNKDVLLPTIHSRCKIFFISTLEISNNEDLREFTMKFINFQSLPLGERLKLAEQIGKDKENALIWIEKLIHAGRGILFQESTQITKGHIMLLKNLQEAHKVIKTTNTNVRLTLERFVIKI